MNRADFGRVLQKAVVGALNDFRRQVPHESPYAWAIILGQCGNYLGYAVATEEGLRRVAARYADKGYRYRGRPGEEFDNTERLVAWLRWSNPDDGWHYTDFPARYQIAPLLARLVEDGEFGEDAEELEAFCTDVLARLQSDPEWLAVTADRSVVVGVTFGSDPRDFLRTATRANPAAVVRQLRAEYGRAEELSSKIPAPG